MNRIQTGLRLDEDIHAKLKAIADKEKRTLNNLIEYVVQCYIEEYEHAHK